MSIAPIMTGMEFTLRPTDAMMIAIARIQAFGPRKYMLLRIAFSAEVVSICSDISRTFLKVWVNLFQSDMYKIH